MKLEYKPIIIYYYIMGFSYHVKQNNNAYNKSNIKDNFNGNYDSKKRWS